MPPNIEERLKALEDKAADFGAQQLHYPLDWISKQILFSTINRRFFQLLRPQDTDDANDGTFIALNNTPAIQFADAATRVAYFSIIPPRDWNIINMKFIWSTPATSGNMRWTIDIGEGGDSDANNARITGGTAVTPAADGTANDLNYTDILSAGAGVILDNLRRDNLWGIKFTRTGADAGDTLTNTVNLYGILFEYKFY
mgnify:CR=1 FL=1